MNVIEDITNAGHCKETKHEKEEEVEKWRHRQLCDCLRVHLPKQINLSCCQYEVKTSKCLKDETLALGDDIFNDNPIVLDME